MGYKLHCEKRHRKTKGGKRERVIEKGVPDGRLVRTDYDEDTGTITFYSAARKPRKQRFDAMRAHTIAMNLLHRAVTVQKNPGLKPIGASQLFGRRA